MYRWKYDVKNTSQLDRDNLVEGFKARCNYNVKVYEHYIYGYSDGSGDVPEGAEVCSLENELLNIQGVTDVDTKYLGNNIYSFILSTRYDYDSEGCNEIATGAYLLVNAKERQIRWESNETNWYYHLGIDNL